ncbi:MAG: hypothetical protein IJJ33_17030 [Victivallales bacterium]|nr:hypothetical protein [Victivallales bacterium]
MKDEITFSPVVALDIGDVCIHVELERYFGPLGFTEKPPWLHALGLELNLGHLTDDGYLMEVASRLPKRFSLEELRELHNALLVEANPGMPEFVASLPPRGIRPVFFSDISRQIHLRARELLHAQEIITEGVFSYEVGAFKPSEQMLSAFEERFGKPLLYLDDLPQNIEGARARGWNAHVFHSASQAEQLLQEALAQNTVDIP